MTQNERIECGRMLCEKLEAEVAAIRPPRITSSAWEWITGLSADFLIALTAWELTGEDKDRLRVRDAYLAVTKPWRVGFVSLHVQPVDDQEAG